MKGMESVMIKSEQLEFEYSAFDEGESPTLVLDGIDIEIKSGDFVAILGHNGSGKSTFARHINALLTPTSGVLWVDGKDTSNPNNVWDIRRTAGMLFQNPDNQIVATTVEEDIAFGPENLGVSPPEIRVRVDSALAAVNMSEYKSYQPHHLSGGQKQRVAIAGVLAMKPNCIVLDEPTAMLDPKGRKEVLGTITQLNKEKGITVILITHYMEEAVLANRVIVLDKGKVAMDGPPKDVFSDVPGMKALMLGVPQVTELAHKLCSQGFPFSDTVLTPHRFIQTFKSKIAKEVSALPLVATSSILELVDDGLEVAPILEVRNLSHIYAQGTPFEKYGIKDVSISINKGEVVSIVGHTGSGKSTLIQHFNALLKPTCGSVLVCGEDIHSDKLSLKSVRQQVGLVFQYPEHQLFESTIYKDVAFGPIRMGMSASEVDEYTRYALQAVGIPESLYHRSPFELSGGQKRRVAIAGVIAMRPKVLVLDEPAAGLDPAGRNEILSKIKHMHKAFDMTVILVSHSMDDAAQLSDRILVMNNGCIAIDGAPAEVFAQAKKLMSIGLDVPQISQIFYELNRVDPRIPTGIFDIEEAVDVLCKVYEERKVTDKAGGTPCQR